MDKSFDQDEHILTAIPVRMKTGLLSNESYHLVLTNKRFIFAHYQRYLVMSPEEILEKNNDDFYCDHGLIHWIELEKREEEVRIMIFTTDLTYQLIIEYPTDIEDIRIHLKNLFSHKYQER